MSLKSLNSNFGKEDIFNPNVGNGDVYDIVGCNINCFGAATAAYIQ